MNMFPQLPNIRPLAFPDRPVDDPANHQHDTVYSLNFGPRILVRTINEDQWNNAIDYTVPEGSRILVRHQDFGPFVIRHILLRTNNSFRRITYVYRPEVQDPYYETLAPSMQFSENTIPVNACLTIPQIDINHHSLSSTFAPIAANARSPSHLENAWHQAAQVF
jgi:hypothetical protein